MGEVRVRGRLRAEAAESMPQPVNTGNLRKFFGKCEDSQSSDRRDCPCRASKRTARVRTTAFYFFLLVLYVVGVPIRFLHRIYQSFMHPTQRRQTSAQIASASAA